MDSNAAEDVDDPKILADLPSTFKKQDDAGIGERDKAAQRN